MAHILKPRVAENSTSTGTGAFALASALTGHQRFNAVCATNDTVEYVIAAADGSWEEGIGTYSAANTLTRTTVTNSSNAGAAVNFAAGDKVVMLTPSASRLRGVEELVSVATASASAFISFTNLEAGYWHRFVGSGIVLSTGASVYLSVSSNNGSTWNSGSTDFTNVDGAFTSWNAAFHTVSDGASGFELLTNNLAAADKHVFRSWAGDGHFGIVAEFEPNTTALNAVRFMPDTGNITSGTISYFRRRIT